MIRKASIRRFLWRHFSLIHLMVYKNSINEEERMELLDLIDSNCNKTE